MARDQQVCELQVLLRRVDVTWLVASRPSVPVLDDPVAADLVAHVEAVKGNAAIGKRFRRREPGTPGTDDTNLGKHGRVR